MVADRLESCPSFISSAVLSLADFSALSSEGLLARSASASNEWTGACIRELPSASVGRRELMERRGAALGYFPPVATDQSRVPVAARRRGAVGDVSRRRESSLWFVAWKHFACRQRAGMTVTRQRGAGSWQGMTFSPNHVLHQTPAALLARAARCPCSGGRW